MSIPLSVIIVNYNTREDLRLCLASLWEIEFAEIIVVDNASRDGSAAMAAAEFPSVRLIAPGRNTWFCGGNNLGLEAAQGEYALLLNPDTVANRAALDAMLEFVQTHPDYAGATVQLRYPDGAIQRTCSRIPSYAYLLLNHTPLGIILRSLRDRLNRTHWYEDWGRDSDRDIDVPPGSCVMMRRDALRLDADLLLYFPEDDLARRCGGRKFRFLAGESIIHREKSATRSWLATDVYFRDLMVYTAKHHGTLARWLLWLLSRPLYWGMWVKHKLG